MFISGSKGEQDSGPVLGLINTSLNPISVTSIGLSNVIGERNSSSQS